MPQNLRTTSDFPTSKASKHSIVLPKTLYISKNFVANIEALVSKASNFETTDSRKMLDARFAKDYKELDRKENQRFDQYVARKLRAWFTMFL